MDRAVVEYWNSYSKSYQTKSKTAVTFLISYYYYLIYYNKYFNVAKNNYIDIGADIDYFCLLSTKFFKTKYTVTDFQFLTVITASVGMILKYFGNFKKFFKKSYRANMLLVRFITNTILKYIRKKKYIFIVEGFNAKLFTYINMFNELGRSNPMQYYFIKPRFIFGDRRFKKIKSIKRKLQRKNLINLNSWHTRLKKFNLNNYKV